MSKDRALRALSHHDRRLAKLGQACELLVPGRFDAEAWAVMDPQLDEVAEAVKIVQSYGRAAYPAWAGKADSWPADNFYAVLWNLTKPTQDETWAKLLEAANGPDTIYRMRKAYSPDWFDPVWDPQGKGGDCSGLVAFGLDRDKDGGDDWQNAAGQDLWLHTGSIYSDAMGRQLLFRRLDAPEPGCLFTYPDRPKSEGGGQGHTGGILELDGLGVPGPGVDCSYKQGKKGDAIRVRSMAWTVGSYARGRRIIFVKPVWWR